MLLLTKASQIYKLHGFVPNPCEICYFVGSYWLNTNVVHYLNMKVECTISFVNNTNKQTTSVFKGYK